MRIGLGIPPVGLPIDLCTDIVRQAEERGFDSIWVGEAWGTETCTLASALLARSQRIHVGTGIVSLYLRPPTLTAMQAATLDLIAPGRARLGLGVSTRTSTPFMASPGIIRSRARANTSPSCAACWPASASLMLGSFTGRAGFNSACRLPNTYLSIWQR